ncbi:MAG: FtsX-like permease family protein [Oscillospiraceae bacterium]|nr:FtsX-like permease family protein [Oscillospiraceae bacterium]
MVTTLLKSTLREIRQSMGRFLALLAIIALGMGFFSGLRMCQPAMMATGVTYLEEHRFHDFRLLSTLGFTAEDVEAFAQAEGIEQAAGSVYTEFLWQTVEKEQAVLVSHMLTPGINDPELLAGRMPAAGSECLGDAARFSEEDIGSVIRVSPANDQDTLDLLAYKEYTLVGIARSPLFLNFERGTAGIGSGSVSAFVLMPQEAFDTEAYFEIYLKMQDAPDAYSGEYQAREDLLKPRMEALLKERADLRYHDLYSDAVEEIREAEQELADGWEEYRTERADAEQELADAYRELLDGEEDYQEGLAELEDGKKEYQEGKEEFEDAVEQIREAREDLKYGLEQMKQAEAQLDKGEKSYQQLDELYQTGAAIAGQMSSFGISTPEELVEALRDPTYGPLLRDQMIANGMTTGQLSQLLGGWAAAEQQLNAPLTADTMAGLEAELEAGRAALQSGWNEYYAGREQYNEGVAELRKAEKELEEAAQEIADGEQELIDGRAELDDGWQEYRDGLAEAEQEFADAEAELADGEQEIADAWLELQDLEMADTYTLTRNENTGYACFDNDTAIVAAISVVFPVFFFLVAALVCMTTMKRMVDEQRTQIGVLKAMGYSRGQIIGKYLFYSGTAAILGALLGYALGSRGMPLIIWQIYGMMYGFAPLARVFDPVLAVVSFAAALVCSMGATWLSCRMELTRPAAELIRPKAPKAGKRIFLERITPIWSRLSFLRKVSVRNVLRYKSRLVMMLIGIGGCTALLITGFGVRDSVAGIVDTQYEEITLYDYAVSFEDPQTAQTAGLFLTEMGREQQDGLLVHQGSADVYSDIDVKTVHLVVPATGELEGFVSLHSGQRDIAMPAEGEVVLNYALAQALEIQPGDKVRLRSDDLGTMELTVADICDNYIFNYAFVSPGSFRSLLGKEPEYKTMYLNATPGADPYQEGVELAEGEGVGSVAVNAATRQQIGGTLNRLDLIVIVVVAFAAALAFVVLYNLTNISITERVREIATVKVLGFYQNETAAYVFREMVMLSFGGGLVGLLMGKALHAFVMSQVVVEGMYFPTTVFPASYAISFVLTLVFAVLITTALRGRLKKIDMAESLKSIE